MKLINPLKIILIVVLLVLLGSWRQMLFININAQIMYLQGGLHSSGLIDTLKFLENWELSTLSASKWILTLSFTLTFFAVSAWAFWIIYKDKQKIVWLAYAYVILLVTSGLFFFVGKVFHIENFGYTIARRCMGALQSPFPAMMLVPAFQLLKSFNLKEK